MRWITEITLNNYKAFGTSFKPLIIPPNHHLLIYGENGSGKSSIYNAIKDFFNSSSDSTKNFILNLFSQSAGNNTGTIELKISDLDSNKTVTTINSYIFGEPDSQSNHRVPAIQLPNKIKGFLDYKRILETYFLKSKSGQNPNLFSLFVEDLLADHTIASSDSGVSTNTLVDEWNRIKDPIYNLDRRSKAHREAIDKLPQFEVNLRQLLTNVFIEFRRIITTYFDPKLEINVSISEISMDYVNWIIKQELFLEINYAGKPITSYDTFLNEARLSAIGVAIYLASIKTYPDATDLKVLFLDDVFIGLDTNNRIPLLKIVNEEFINHGYQIFLSTYDRQWFETARFWLQVEKCSIISIELYTKDDGNPLNPDVPIIISPSQNYFEKAKSYFDKKDYPASANYLRKSCEKELKRILPNQMKLIANIQTGVIKTIDKLENLVDKFKSFLVINSLDLNPFQHFKTYKKILLNPLSHDDLLAPHYRNEILDGIEIVNSLQKIRIKEIVTVKSSSSNPMKLEMVDSISGNIHNYEIKVLENLLIIQQDAAPIQLSVIKCEVIEATTRKFTSLQVAFDEIWRERGNSSTVIYNEFYSRIKISNTKKLIDLMEF